MTSPISDRLGLTEPHTTMLCSVSFNSPMSTALHFAILALVVLLSFSYRHVKGLSLSKRQSQLLTTIHAFATESAQLSLATLGALNFASFVNTIQNFQATCRVSGGAYHAAVYTDTALNQYTTCRISVATGILLVGLAGIGISVVQVAAVFTVDLIEGRILTGRWTHPYSWQCFIVTRSILFGKRTSTKLSPLQRDRAQSEPRTKHDFCRNEAKMHQDLKMLSHLDLANRCGGKVDYSKQCHDNSNHNKSASTRQSCISHKSTNLAGNGQQASGLPPTPPDSDSRVEGAKRVRWASTMTVLSPNGALRRQSLP